MPFKLDDLVVGLKIDTSEFDRQMRAIDRRLAGIRDVTLRAGGGATAGAAAGAGLGLAGVAAGTAAGTGVSTAIGARRIAKHSSMLAKEVSDSITSMKKALSAQTAQGPGLAVSKFGVAVSGVKERIPGGGMRNLAESGGGANLHPTIGELAGVRGTRIKDALISTRKGLDDVNEATKKTTMSWVGFTAKLAVAAAGIGLVIAGLVKLTKGLFDFAHFAADAEDAQKKLEVVFKDLAPGIIKWSNQLGQQVGIARQEVVGMMADLGDLLIPMGYSEKAAAVLSGKIVTLAKDLSVHNRLPTEKVILDIKSALAGSNETLNKYGVIIKESTIKAKALDLEWIKQGETLSEQAKALIKIKLLYDGNRAALNAATDRAGDFTSQNARLSAVLLDLKETISKAILPAATDFLTTLNQMIKGWEIYIQKNPDILKSLKAIGENLFDVALIAIYAGKSIAEFVAKTLNFILPANQLILGKAKDWANTIKEDMKTMFDEIKAAGKEIKTGFSDEEFNNIAKDVKKTADSFEDIKNTVSTMDIAQAFKAEALGTALNVTGSRLHLGGKPISSTMGDVRNTEATNRNTEAINKLADSIIHGRVNV